MPARQDQTLQIFLIVFIFAFLVSAVVAYLGWKGYGDSETRAAALQTSLNDKTTQTQTQQVELEDLRERIGFGRNDNTADVLKSAEEDMKNYGAGVAEEASRTYRNVLEVVYNEAKTTAEREAKLKDNVKELNRDLEAVQTESDKKIAEIENARQTAEQKAADERSAFAEDRAKMKKSEERLAAKVESQKTDFETKLAAYETEKKALLKEVEDLTRAKDNLLEQRKDEPGSFEIADGRISWVNQNGTVWINLGTADSLRRQVTFSVFDADQHDAAKATKKGSIEVTKLLGEHMAEARITNDSPTNPILTGDLIYSQIWHRGKKLRFALTGVIDFDGDGRSEMQLARDLIELNGGIVDAYLTDDGQVEGTITANTRYLVLGDSPELASQSKLQNGWNMMSQEASKMGVETITLSEFLAQMGYKPQDRTVPLGPGATARDFPARPEDSSPPVASPRFRPRVPYRAPAETPK